MRRTRPSRRRGLGLVAAVAIVACAVAAMSLMTKHVGQLASQRLHDRARTFAQVLVDSGMAYAKLHSEELSRMPAGTAVELPTNGLLPAPARPRLTLAIDENTVRIVASVTYARASAREEVRLAR